MMVRRLSAVDAQMYWMSAKIPNDQFLLYGFSGVPSDVEETLASVRVRAGGCADLCLRVRDRGVLTYPAWVPGDVSPDQFVVHELDDNSWAGCLAAIARLPEHQLDAQAMSWRHGYSAARARYRRCRRRRRFAAQHCRGSACARPARIDNWLRTPIQKWFPRRRIRARRCRATHARTVFAASARSSG